jgi:hypothetical protein
VAVASARGFGFNRQMGGNRRPHGSTGGSGNSGGSGSNGGAGQWATKLCDNASLAEAFLNQTQQLILQLQANGSYAGVLQERAQEVAYLQNATNTALLSSNCTGFFIGLSNACKLDKLAEAQEEQYEQNAAGLFKQIVQSLVGSRNVFGDNF